jgi:hypothetical protein
MADIENTFTLADLARATKRRLGPTRLVIGDDLEVDLPSIFRLPQKTREKVWEALREVNKIGEDTDEEIGYALLVEAISETLLLVTPDAQKILDAVALAAEDDDLVAASLLGDVLGKWMEHTQAGEA